MTLLDDRSLLEPGTGPLVGPSSVARLHAPATRSQAASSADRTTIDRAERLRSQWGAETPERMALLGIVLARLSSVPFERVALLLDVKPKRLEKFMHGEEQIPTRFVQRWQLLAESLEDLHSVLLPRATDRWLNTALPAASNRTPLELAARGEMSRLRELTARYRDTSFA